MSAFPKTPLYVSEPVFPLSVEQYHSMIDAGTLGEDDPVELIEGALVFKMPKNPPHEASLGQIQDLFPSRLLPGWLLRLQAPITLSDSEPEPDATIVRGQRGDYRKRHPHADEVALVIEVANTTLPRDRGMKLRTYARAGVATYWIVNLVDRHIEVYTNPDGNCYQTVREIRRGERLTLPAVLSSPMNADELLLDFDE